MTKKELSLEEQRLKSRRKLLKMAVYSIPAIATILATEEAYADGGGEREREGEEEGERGRKRKGTKRKKPHGPKKFKKGLS